MVFQLSPWPKCQTSYELNLMQMSKSYCFGAFATCVNITTQARFKCVPTFCGSIIIHIFTLLFFLIEYSSFTDRLLSEDVAGYCTSANALMLGVIVRCDSIRKKGLEKLKACTWES